MGYYCFISSKIGVKIFFENGEYAFNAEIRFSDLFLKQHYNI